MEKLKYIECLDLLSSRGNKEIKNLKEKNGRFKSEKENLRYMINNFSRS